MNLSSIAKKNCYYSLNCVGAATKDALKIEFKTYYTTPGAIQGLPGLGVGTLEEIDLPPLDGNEISTPVLSQYSPKLVHFDANSNNDTGAGTTYEIPALFTKNSSHWEFYTYDQMIQKNPPGFEANANTISTTFETFVIGLRTNWLSFEKVEGENKFNVTVNADKEDIYKLPYNLAASQRGGGIGYGMDIDGAGDTSGDQTDLDLQTIVEAATSGVSNGAAYEFKAVGKGDTPYIEDFSFEYDTPYSKDGITASGVNGKALDADVKFRYHYYLKDYEDAVNNLPDASTSISEIGGIGTALKTTGDRVEFLLPNPYDYEYANFVLDNPYYSNISVGNGNDQVSPLADTTKNVLNSIAAFKQLYGADYADYTSLGGKISFSLIRDGSTIDYLREWSKAAKWYQQKSFEFESKQVQYTGEAKTVMTLAGPVETYSVVVDIPSEVAKNRNRFLAESAKIDSEGPPGMFLPGTIKAEVPAAPDSLNSLLNNATFDYFNFNHPDIEKYFGDLDFTLRNSLNIGQESTKRLSTSAAFPMSVEIKFKYPTLTLFSPLAQRTKEWLPNKVTDNPVFSTPDSPGGSLSLHKHGGLMQKVMAMNLAGPFMSRVVEEIDIPSGGPTPINEEKKDPTIISSEAKTPNFAKQTKILQKEQYGYRTDSIKLHSADLDSIIDKMMKDNLDEGLQMERKTEKIFFSDRAEDFFLPMGASDVEELKFVVRDHKKTYEDTANEKNTRRDFKDILEGKKCFVETLFFGIEKYEVTRDDRGRHVPINRNNSVQRFFVTPPPLAGNNSTDEYVRYVDTQVKFGKKYVYQTFAYVLVYGTQYRCSEINQTSKNSKLAVEMNGEDINAPVPAFEITYQSKPAYKIFKVPYHGIDFEDKGGVFFPTRITNNPPTAPYMSVLGYRGVNDKVLINMQPSSGDRFQFPISIREDEKKSYEPDPANIYFGSSPPGMIRFTSDDRVSGYRIYRLDKPPKTYADFKNSTIFEIDTKLGSSLKDTIAPNVRYYYTAKAIDIHNMYSNPCPVYSVEIVDEKGLIYTVIEEYEMNIKDKKTRTKTGRKAIYIAPDREQIKIKINGDPENPELGARNKSVFAKRFKVRLTSKKTNKMIDFNLRFDQVNENKKTLEKTSILTKEFLPKYSAYSEYGSLLTPDFDLALMLTLGEAIVENVDMKSDDVKGTPPEMGLKIITKSKYTPGQEKPDEPKTKEEAESESEEKKTKPPIGESESESAYDSGR